jgi:hypothetical protein
MAIHRQTLCAGVFSLLLTSLANAAPPEEGRAPRKERHPAAQVSRTPKYYFKIAEISVGKDEDPEVSKLAREYLEKDLSSRAEFTNDLGDATEGAALLDELKRRGLKGFRVTLRLDQLVKDLKEPKPGGRLKQLAVDLKVSVFGTTFPGEKLAFSGEGESVVEAEIVEQRLEQESLSLLKEVMPRALKQAVDQAVTKLSLPKSAPMNESKRRRKS